MSTFEKAELDALYTFMEDVMPMLDQDHKRDAEYFMDRCEDIIGPIRRQGQKLNTGRFGKAMRSN